MCKKDIIAYKLYVIFVGMLNIYIIDTVHCFAVKYLYVVR